jgi:hypothetical protein
MPTETAVVVAAIVLAFTGFALTLWWAERQTRDIKGSDQKALPPSESREASRANSGPLSRPIILL